MAEPVKKADVLLIRNMADGPRDYPLKNGSSIFLPPKGRDSQWRMIPANQFSTALAYARDKGYIAVKGADTK